jgi:N-acetylglucosaminyldiphosphoundecaprenol N-acetyl-beta-D-mannosaminyltransferase
MSSEQILQRINATDADFVVVALGAKKGQAWIMANLDKLRAPVVSHLGAVVNFAAGNVARAPGWMQTLGLEWAWRIWQEPALWKRYGFDGLRLVELLVFKVLPYVLWRGLHSRRLKSTSPVDYSVTEDEQSATIHLRGDCLHATIAPLRTLFARESSKCRPLTLDLAGVDLIDGAFLGLCLSLYKSALEHGFGLSFTNPGPAQRRIFKWNGAEYLL